MLLFRVCDVLLLCTRHTSTSPACRAKYNTCVECQLREKMAALYVALSVFVCSSSRVNMSLSITREYLRLNHVSQELHKLVQLPSHYKPWCVLVLS